MRHCLALTVIACLSFTTLAASQEKPLQRPPDYPGVGTHVAGVFVTPTAGAPFSGIVEIVSKEILPDGSVNVLRTINHIGRNSAGTIHNENRRLVLPTFQGEPELLSFFIYDPHSRIITHVYPKTHIARQILLKEQPGIPTNSTPGSGEAPKNEKLTTQDLGTQTVATLRLRGTRKQRTIPASLSGTGREVTITDDYWYSDELNVYLALRHDDPRTGEQTVGITKFERGEPDSAIFQVPTGYKIVDETPMPESH